MILRAVLFAGLAASAVNGRAVKAGYNNNPPQMYRTSSGAPAGFVIEVVNQAATSEGIQVEWVYLPEGASFGVFESGVIEIWPAAVRTPERERKLHFTSTWWRTDAIIVAREGISTPSDLSGKRIAVPADLMEPVRRLLPHAAVAATAGTAAGLTGVCTGQADAAVMDHLLLDRFLLHRPAPCAEARFTLIGLPGAAAEIAIVSRRQAADKADRLRSGIETLESNGRLIEIGLAHSLMSGASAGFLSVLNDTRHRYEILRLAFILVSCTLIACATLVYWLAKAVGRRRAAEAGLLQTNADLEQFNSAIHHDLAEPLRNIAIFSELLDREHRAGISTEGAVYMGLIQDSATRMVRLLESLRSYSDIWQTKGPLTEFESREALDEALELLKPEIQAAGAVITAGALPKVTYDRAHLIQVFGHLLSNALLYRGGRAPLIRVECARTGADYTFSVSDNGIGIDPVHQERIFRVFKRLHGSEVPGTGIGLALCRRIVERHGGSIRVESKPGSGSRFLFTIPARSSRFR